MYKSPSKSTSLTTRVGQTRTPSFSIKKNSLLREEEEEEEEKETQVSICQNPNPKIKQSEENMSKTDSDET